MNRDALEIRPGSAALDAQLTALLGWFQAAPLPEEFACVIEQLEAAYRQAEPHLPSNPRSVLAP